MYQVFSEYYNYSSPIVRNCGSSFDTIVIYVSVAGEVCNTEIWLS